MKFRGIVATCLIVALALSVASPVLGQFNQKSDTGYFSPRRDHIPSSVDFIVIGSGPGGSAVASRLSEVAGYNVMLLERGSDLLNLQMLQIPRDWSPVVYTAGNKPTVIDVNNEPVVVWNDVLGRVSNGFALGGTSMINSQMWVRGNAADYDNWASSYGATGWDYASVLPYFRKIENDPIRYASNPTYHNIGGPVNVSEASENPVQNLQFIAAAEASGLSYVADYNGADQLGGNPNGSVSIFEFSLHNGKRVSAYQSYILPNLQRPNLWVVDSAHVTKINFDPHNRAVSVSWFDTMNNQQVTTYATREIILSAGAIHTPQLLQISGVGDGAHLDSLGIDVVANLSGVGQNFMDHLITNVNGVGLTFTPVPYTDSVPGPDQLAQWVVNGTGPYSWMGGSAVMFMRTKYQIAKNDPRPDIQYITLTPGSSNYAVLYLLRPRSRGNVLIASKDPFVDPRPLGNFLSHPEDIPVFCEGIRMMYNVFSQAAGPGFGVSQGPAAPSLTFTDAECGYYLAGAAPWSNGNSNLGDHWAGTARMGVASDPMAVVDARLRVYGVTGLRVVDASVFPEIPSGNTQAPTYMVGEKAADMIIADNPLNCGHGAC